MRASLSHFLANEWDRERALKRGGARKNLSLDAQSAEERYRLEPVDGLTPEAIFEREWAGALLATCLRKLREGEDAAGRSTRFDVLRPFLVGDAPALGYPEAAGVLGLEEPAVRVAVHRLRKLFAAVLREEIGRTVADPADIDSEIRWLLGAVRGGG